MLNKIKNFLLYGKDHFIKVIFNGLFWLAPMVAVTLIVLWIYDKIDAMTGQLFQIIGMNPQHYPFLWTIVGVIILAFIAYVIGIFVETKLGDFIQRIYSKIPGYETVKELINIFNTSKSGEQKVLVVLIRGFASQGYNIGLMYSTKESIVKDHYTVTLSMTPIPNGGYMFEVHKDNIYIIEEATFDSNLEYLLSMGVKSIADIIESKPKDIDSFVNITSYLDQKENLK